MSKIFNLGLHKTGTESIHHLMKDLSISSLHEPTFNIFNHTAADLKKELTLYDCYSGGIASKYKEVYESYPDAKYLLTIRNPNSWLQSSRNHYSDLDGSEYVKSIFGVNKPFELSDEEMINIFNNFNKKIIDLESEYRGKSLLDDPTDLE